MMEPPPTLHTILAARQLAKTSLDVKCAEKHLIAITQSITSWKQLSPFLGLSQQDEEDIEADNSKNAKKKVAMMRRWSEKFGEEATYLRMAEAFETLQWRNCICDLLDLLQDRLRTAEAEATGPPRGEALQRSLTSPLGKVQPIMVYIVELNCGLSSDLSFYRDCVPFSLELHVIDHWGGCTDLECLHSDKISMYLNKPVTV